MTAIEDPIRGFVSGAAPGATPGSAIWVAVDQGARRYGADATAYRRARYRMAIAVADGVGDSLDAAWAGQVAADTAVRAGLGGGALEALAEARDVVLSVDPAGAGDSALVVAVGECRTGWDVAWVGDCRAWTWRDGMLEQVTTDHTVAQRMRELGEQPPPPATEHVLTSSLRSRLVPDGFVRVPPGPLLLTTDGVHKSLDPAEIEAALRDADERGGDPAEALVAAARRAGARDNAAAVLVRAAA
ncbi:MAG TPA: serine/threonine protein phosphatase [Pseudonocardia sp.]|jgi:protein phosphatase|nr:serine/threonine protein phosphatase [Pseudonocardia sp.]